MRAKDRLFVGWASSIQFQRNCVAMISDLQLIADTCPLEESTLCETCMKACPFVILRSKSDALALKSWYVTFRYHAASKCKAS